MVNKENYYQEYIVYAKYQIVSIQAVVQVDFPAYALSEHKQNLSKKTKCKKMLSSKNDVILAPQKIYGIRLHHANVQCVYIVDAKYQIASIKALVQIDFRVHALSEH